MQDGETCRLVNEYAGSSTVQAGQQRRLVNPAGWLTMQAGQPSRLMNHAGWLNMQAG
jgi:hypothetical protein